MRAALLALLWLPLASACGAPPEPASVVLVLVDQLRADSFEEHAPLTSALAARGVRFTQMRSAAPWTYPSVVSLMSGLYPQQHGADGELRANRLRRFSEAVPLIQGRLSEAGWRTAAFVANPFLHDWNPFHLGFASYDASFVKDVGNRRPTGPQFAKPERMFSPTLNEAIRAHFTAPPEAPEFTYVHYIDVHGPWAGAPFPHGYEDAVAFTDARIVELYEFFLDRYDGNLLFFVTSDHGRALADDEVIGYGKPWRLNKRTMHDFNLHVPFVLLPSDLVAAREPVDVPASNVDFVPTLLDLLGLAPDPRLPGVSLAPWIRGESPRPPGRSLYARRSAFGAHSDALLRDGRKYVRFFDVRSGGVTARRIFDLAADPREERSLGDDFGPVEVELEEAAGTRGVEFPVTVETPEPELERQLRGLGYLDEEGD